MLAGVSLAVREREIVSIIGPNGAGKSTLFNVVCGAVQAKSGSVIYRGRNITGWPPHRICRAGIARTFQIARPFPEMTCAENVRIGLWFGKKDGQSRIENRAVELLELVGLQRKAHVQAKELTFSELHKLELARALGTGPDLLLLDEIATGLSPQAINEAVELVKRLRDQGLTLILIDHFLNLTARVSDQIIALRHGKKIAEGRPSEVLQSREVIDAYLGEGWQRAAGRVDG